MFTTQDPGIIIGERPASRVAKPSTLSSLKRSIFGMTDAMEITALPIMI
jgi:hypothetical protein